MDTIIKATPLADYRIEIVTSSGVSGIFDVKPYLRGSAFKELTDEGYFRLMKPAHHGIRDGHTIIFDIQTVPQEQAVERSCSR